MDYREHHPRSVGLPRNGGLRGLIMDLTTLTDKQLDAHRVEVACEQERRARLAAIPEQVTAAAEAWREAGRDPQELVDTITESRG